MPATKAKKAQNHRFKKSTATADMFESGLYTQVALYGAEGDWQTHAARGICGLGEVACCQLDRFDHCEARFYQAVGYWIDGNQITAEQLLIDLSDTKAARLLSLIRQDKIRILAQQPEQGCTPHVAFSGGMSDPHFDIRNISFNGADANLNFSPEQEINHYTPYGWSPDLYIAVMLEWQKTPLALDSLRCPIFGQTADFDLHFHPVLRQLAAYDEIVVTDGSEWQDCRKLTTTRITTFPKVFGLADYDFSGLPLLEQNRDIDIFMSGTVFHPYHPDKARLIQEIMHSSAQDPLIINGFLTHQDYFRLLMRTKCTLSYYRHSGGFATRAMEALALGSPVLMQAGNVMQLFVGDEHGIIEYVADTSGSLINAIEKIMAQPEYYLSAAKRGAEKIRAIFDSKRIGSQYYRYLTFRAAIHDALKTSSNRKNEVCLNRRVILEKGWLPGNKSGAIKTAKININEWLSEEIVANRDECLVTSAREYALLYIQAAGSENSELEYLNNALDLLSISVSKNPNRLVTVFQLARLMLHYGNAEQSEHGLRLMEEIASRQPCYFNIKYTDDIWPYDLWAEHFDYRTYQDILVESSGNIEIQQRHRLIKCIQASAIAYIGICKEDASLLEKAMEYNTTFAYYQLWWARLFLRSDRYLDNHGKLINILLDLSRNTNLFVEANHLLQMLCHEGIVENELIQQHSARFREAYMDFDAIQQHSLHDRRTRHSCLPRVGKPTVLFDNRDRNGDVRASILIYHHPALDITAIKKSLTKLLIIRDQFEVIWIDPFSRPAIDSFRIADCVIACNQSDYDHSMGHGLNAGLLVARGDVVLVPEGKLTLDESSCRSLLNILAPNSRPDGNRAIAIWPKSNISSYIKAKNSTELLTLMTKRDHAYIAAFRRIDLFEILGFDEGASFHGNAGGCYEAAVRLLNRACAWVVVTVDQQEIELNTGSWYASKGWYPDGSEWLNKHWRKNDRRLLSTWKRIYSTCREQPTRINPMVWIDRMKTNSKRDLSEVKKIT